jgi:hypothetical protein
LEGENPSVIIRYETQIINHAIKKLSIVSFGNTQKKTAIAKPFHNQCIIDKNGTGDKPSLTMIPFLFSIINEYRLMSLD